MDIKGLNKFITDLKPQSRLQLVVIKTLLENDCHATTEILASELGFYNKEHPDKYYKSTVFSILEDKRVISQSGHQEYSLNFGPNNAFDVLEAISLCNQKIHFGKIKPNVRYFTAVGPWKSWEYTIENLPLRWGVDKRTATKSLTTYNTASKGDIVFYYSTRKKPTNFTKRGFFGIGVVKETRSITKEKYWPEEKEADKTLFTYKIFLDTLKFARSDQELIPISDGLPSRRGFSHINPGKPLDELLENTKNKWNIFVSDEKQMPSDRKITPGKPLDELLENTKNKWNIFVSDEKQMPTEPAPFHLPLGDELENIKKLIQEDLLIDGSVIDRIIISLYTGRNVLLTGQVGTGKTDLAQKISKVLNYYPEVHTATSDWSTQDVIGGIFPKIEKGAVGFRMQDGCVISTISKNWKDRTGSGGVRKLYSKFDRKTGKTHHYCGVWLVIDEFNRANIDRAFGQLFTAFEYKEQLKMPIESLDDADNGDFQTFIIPEDYRIIGTLNTHDRHFLFNLSDALKRRFDFIEIGIPPRDPENREISMVRKKVAADSELSNWMKELDSSNEQTDKKLYEIVLFIRKSKPIGTALLISMLRDMLVYHKMGQSWDGGLDSALAKTIIPQIEDLPASTLGSIKRFVNGDMASFFVKFSRHDHAEKVEDYVKELEKYETYYRERFKNKVSKKWSREFKEGNLSKLANQPRDPEQTNNYKSIVEELNPWQEELKRPALTLFRKSLDSLAEEKESFSVNVIESGSD